MFIPGFIIIKMSKIAQFLSFLLMTLKNKLHCDQNIYLHLKDLIDFFQKILWLIGFGITVSEILRVEISKFSRFEILLIVLQNPIIHRIFEKLNKCFQCFQIFQMHLVISFKLWLIVCCHHQKIQNVSHF